MSHPSKWRRTLCDIYPERQIPMPPPCRKVRFAIRPITRLEQRDVTALRLDHHFTQITVPDHLNACR